jgi:S1-C subfamily serine protease
MNESPDSPLPASNPGSHGTASGAEPQIVFIHSLPPPESAARAAAMRQHASFSLSRLMWLVTIVSVLLGVYTVIPRFVEEVSYRFTRGKQRAEYENARQLLADAPLADLSIAYQLVSQKVGPAVVHINVEADRPGDVADEAINRFHRFRDFSGQGSGVIVDADGYIVTNLHVVRGADKIQVSLSDGRRVRGELVGVDDETDIAVVKVDAGKLLPADWGDSEAIDVGALVWAVGSPFGLERTVTAGILSAKHRAGLAGTPYQDFLQTDAAVNPGNSGGPLVDAQGQIVGINTAIVGEAYQGISFAVPSAIARGVYERLREKGRVARGWLGVQLAAVPADTADELKLPTARGAMIAGLVNQSGEQSPAQQAGLRKGDIVVRWNENEVTSPASLSTMVAQTEIGTNAKVVVLREGQEQTFNVLLGERPSTR